MVMPKHLTGSTGPILYNLYTSDFRKTNQTSLFAYADDLAILASCGSEKLATGEFKEH